MTERFEHYEIGERIGSGGLADVYAAVDTRSGQEVALKILRDPQRDETHVRRFLREGRLLRGFSHEHLPRCLQVLTAPRPALVLERLRGRSLSQRLRAEGRLTHREIEAIARAVLEVLAFLHGHGVIHRDVKAGNIYLERDGRILLMDLGLAVDPADVLTTTLGDVIGTYAYMAPEQIAGAEVDHRCDLYSLGVTLYEAIAGRRPFRAEGAVGYLEAHLSAEYIPLEDVAPPDTPRRLVSLVERLMSRDPAERPATARVALALLSGQSLHNELRSAPLVGRCGVLGAVEAVLDAGGVIHLVGEPGMGLGRCARLAWARARSRGVEVITLRGGRIRDEAGLCEALARALSPSLGRLPPRTGRLTEALKQLVSEGSVVVLVEDIDQLAEEPLAALAELVRASGVAAITTAHKERSSGFPTGHTVRLRALTLDETRALICGMLATRAAPPELVEGLFTFSDGLPVVIVATLRDLHRRGTLRWLGLDSDGQQRWQLIRTDWLSPEHPLRWSFRSTLEALGRDERALLEVLAVAEEPVPLSVALAAAGLDEGTTASLRLARRHLAEEWDQELPGELLLASSARRPTHTWLGCRRPVVGAMVRLELSEERSRALHRALAGALEELAPGRWRDERLPYHQALALTGAQAAQALVGLGDWLAREQYYNRALRVLERVPPDRELIPLAAAHRAAARGMALLALGRAAEARLSLSAAHRLASDLGRSDIAGTVLVSLGQLHARYGDVARAQEIAEEVLASSAGSVQDHTLPEAMVLRAEVLRLQGHSLVAGESFHSAMDVAMIQGRMDLVARAQVGMARLAMARGDTEQAGHDLAGAAELFLAESDSEGLVECCFERSQLALRQAQVGRALEYARQAELAAREVELPRGRAWGAIARAGVHLACGDLEGAARILREERFGHGGEADQLLRMHWLELVAELRLLRGDRPAALAIHQQAQKLASAAGWFVDQAYHQGMISILTARGGDLSEALTRLYEADDRLRAARLLLEGARMTADVEILAEAREELRSLGDRFMLLRALHMTGGDEAREEVLSITDELLGGVSGPLREHIQALTAVSWAR